MEIQIFSGMFDACISSAVLTDLKQKVYPPSSCPLRLSKQVWHCLTSVSKRAIDKMWQSNGQMVLGFYRYYWSKLFQLKSGSNKGEFVSRLCYSVWKHGHIRLWWAFMYSCRELFIGQSIQETSQTRPTPPSLCVWVKKLQSFLGPLNGCLAVPQRIPRTQAKCFSSGWC